MSVLKRHKIARQMVVSNVVGVLVSGVSLVVGFYLGHALQKPRLSIVDLDQNFYYGMENIRSAETQIRTGDMDFDVGVVNTGDFDGVVSRFGKLTFPGGWFTIHADKYKVVKAHGFETIEFSWRGSTTNEGEALNKWKEIVKNHGESRFRIELESGDGKRIIYDAALSR
jgi:hypothetical protein